MFTRGLLHLQPNLNLKLNLTGKTDATQDDCCISWNVDMIPADLFKSYLKKGFSTRSFS